MGRNRAELRTQFYLPPEVCTEVLSRLPVKSVLRFRSVCKAWRSLIDDPDFVSLHLTNFKNNSDQSHLFLVDIRPRRIRCAIRRSDTFRKSTDLEFRIEEKRSYEVVGYLNGLLALIKLGFPWIDWRSSSLIVWNPSIRKCIKPPLPSSPQMSRAASIVSGLGFDSRSNDYQVVLILYPAIRGEKANIPVVVDVYSIRTGMWRQLRPDDFPCLRCLKPAVFVSGAMHWLACGLNAAQWLTKSSKLVSFDVANEIFSCKELPRLEEGDLLRERWPLAVGDSVGLLDLCNEQNCIWALERCGESVSWTKKYTIGFCLGRLLYLKQNGEFIFSKRAEGVQSYDVERQQRKVLARTCPQNVTYSDAYVESLVLSKVMNVEPLPTFP